MLSTTELQRPYNILEPMDPSVENSLIVSAVEQVAQRLVDKFKHPRYINENIVFLTANEGARYFSFDLIRMVGKRGLWKIKDESFKAKSYGTSNESSGRVSISDLQVDYSKNIVVFIDDIFDTGNTFEQASEALNAKEIIGVFAASKEEQHNPNNLRKPFAVAVPFRGKPFLIGYGLDGSIKDSKGNESSGYFRWLPDIIDLKTLYDPNSAESKKFGISLPIV